MLCDEIQVDAIASSLRSGRRTRVRLYGTSMLPLVLPGAELEFEAVDPSACDRGDVVLVQRGSILAAHRWLGGSPGRWVLQADSLEQSDTPVRDDQVLGRAVGLPVGIGSIPLPRGAQRPIANAIVNALPLLRDAGEVLRGTARVAARGAQRSSVLHAIRKRTVRWSVERFEEKHMPGIRRLALSHGARPNRALLVDWQRLLTATRSVAYVAACGRRIVGYTSVRENRTDPAIGWVGFLWVSRWYRGLGIGTALLKSAVDHVRPLGYRELRADVVAQGDAYFATLKLGFVPAPEIPVANPRRIMTRLRFAD